VEDGVSQLMGRSWRSEFRGSERKNVLKVKGRYDNSDGCWQSAILCTSMFGRIRMGGRMVPRQLPKKGSGVGPSWPWHS
jgi:hypothetical protein